MCFKDKSCELPLWCPLLNKLFNIWNNTKGLFYVRVVKCGLSKSRRGVVGNVGAMVVTSLILSDFQTFLQDYYIFKYK